MESPVPTSPSSLATSSTPLSFKTPTRSPAPTLPVSTPSPAPLQYPEPPDEFVQDNITYLNREKTTKKAARLGSSHVWKYGLRYIRDSDKKEVYYCHECAAGKHKQELFIINGTSGVRNHLEQKHQIDPQSGIKKRSRTRKSVLEQQRSAAATNTFFWKDSIEKFKELLVRWIVYCHIAFFQFENHHLPKAAKTIRSWVMDAFRSKKQRLREDLRQARSRISISFDLWTSPNPYAVLGVIAMWIDTAGKRQTTVLGIRHVYGEHTGENIGLTPQRRVEFAAIIVGGDLAEFDKLELIQNNSTRWNSWFHSITRALNVRERLEIFSARHVPGKGSHGIANFKLDGQHWFELEKIELALKDFYAATLLSEGKKTSLADWFSTLDCLLREINETKDHYDTIDTEDDNNFTWKYLQGCADAAWLKCEEYYSNQQLNWQNRFPEDTDLPPAYYAAQILDPYRKWAWFRQEWVLQAGKEKQMWFDNAQSAVKQLWETEYKGRYAVEMLPPPVRKERYPDPAFDRQREHKRIRIDAPVSAADLYEQYISIDRLHDDEAGCDEAIAYWLSRYDSQRDLARFALDLFAISPMSDECERLFSSAKLTIVDRRGRLKADIIEACECLRAWYGKPRGEENNDSEDSENDDDWATS
ncbi:hypothetical protein FOFC_06303 [Fusarium oxysporum]|nr:hypothetical protein FOFC_20867 [Fusarium oxysporum]KAI8406013.1 hypothetical protein FOFC_13478 [Fusarium oxysporum]KAI8413028.1 hypothetical protein FOFC_06303 [Fusarium oxysporum]